MLRKVLRVARLLAVHLLEEAARRVAGRSAEPEVIERVDAFEEQMLLPLSPSVALTPRAAEMVQAGLQPPRRAQPDPHAPEPPLRGSAAAQRAAERYRVG